MTGSKYCPISRRSVVKSDREVKHPPVISSWTNLRATSDTVISNLSVFVQMDQNRSSRVEIDTPLPQPSVNKIQPLGVYRR